MCPTVFGNEKELEKWVYTLCRMVIKRYISNWPDANRPEHVQRLIELLNNDQEVL